LGPKEGVEVPLGKPPGDKFAIPDKLIDYSTWNDGKMDAMLADPIAAMTSIETTLSEYIKNVNEYNASFLEYKARLEEVAARRPQVLKEKGQAETTLFDQNVLIPLATQTATLHLNTRYFALGALSMRRFIAGRLYISLKARAIAHPEDPQWEDFLSRYNGMLSTFEQSIVPQLVAADI
jgi:hypothetical protein